MNSPFIRNIRLILIFLLPTLLYGQSTIEQAIFLRKFIKTAEASGSTEAYFSENPEDVTAYVDALRRYLDIPESVSDEDLGQEISDRLFGNPFISSEENEGPKILLPNSYSNLILPAEPAPRTIPPVYSDGSSVGSYAPTAGVGGLTTRLVDGLGRWLVKRTKQELSLTFFNRFKDALNKQPDLNVLFPQTVSLLNVFEDEIYHYQAFIGTLRESFINDFHLVPQNLSEWAQVTNLIEDPSERFVVKEAFEIPPMIINGDSPRDILEYLGSVSNSPKEFKDVFSSFQVMDLLSKSLFNFSQDGWKFPYEWEEQVDQLTMYLYLGIIYEKGKNIEFSENKFSNILQNMANDGNENKTSEFHGMIREFLKHGQQTNQFFKSISNNDSINYPDYHQYTTSVIKFLETSNQLYSNFISPNANKKFDLVLNTIQNTNDLIFHIHQDNYLQSVSHINQIIGNFFPNLSDSQLKALLPDEQKTYLSREKKKDRFMKYATFMGTVADAQTSEQVELAFDVFALPPGSSKLKKSSRVSVALNAYVGPTVGLERLENLSSSTIFALHAPVGINLNWGLPKNKGSFSLFTPIIDVGAITAFRFGDDASTLPELSFKNIIAPGIYAVYGFGRDLPFAFGIGGQIGPNTRRIEINEIGLPVENRVESGFRIGAFLSVDIPVFHFYTK